MNLSYRIYYVWKRNLIAYKRFIIPTLLVSLGEPFFYLIAMGLGLGSYMGLFGGKPYLQFLAPGLIVASCMLTATFECLYDSYVRMVIEKIYSSLLVTPISAEDIVAGDIFWGASRGLLSGLLMLMIASMLGAAPASFMGGIALIGLMVVVGMLFGSLAMIMTSLAPNFDFFNYYTQLVISPFFFFSGVFFPLDNFPPWLQAIAQFSPLTQAVIISRALFEGTVTLGTGLNLLSILIPTGLFFYLAIISMKRRLIQ